MNRNETETASQEKIKFELKTETDWKQLDEYLEQFSYIEGWEEQFSFQELITFIFSRYSFSNHDVSQWAVVKSQEAKVVKYVNISRWYNHVKHVK